MADEGPPVKKHRTAGPNDRSIGLMIPPESVSLVIGKKGETVQQIEATSGMGISFTKMDELVQNLPLRRCTLTGSAEAIVHGIQLLCPIIAWKPSPESQQFKMTFLVPDAAVSGIIGKKGVGVQAIQNESGSMLSFAKPHEMPSSPTERPLTVTGSTEAIVSSLGKILSFLEQYIAGGEGGQPQHVPPPTPPRPIVQAYTPPVASYNANSLSSWGGKCGNGKGWDGGGYGQQKGGYAGAYSNPPPAASYHQASSGPSIEMQLLLPDHVTGILIGPRGATLKTLEESCKPDSVYVSFAKPESNQTCPDSGIPLRPVTLRGSIRACMKAQGFLLQNLQSYATSRNEQMICRSSTVLGDPGAVIVDDKAPQ